MQALKTVADRTACISYELIPLAEIAEKAVEAGKLREQADVEDIDLAESIRKYGIITPIIVAVDGGKYKVIDGWRVVKAALSVWRTKVEQAAVKVPAFVDKCGGNAELMRLVTHILQKPVKRVDDCKKALMDKLVKGAGTLKVSDVQCPICALVLKLYTQGQLDERLSGLVGECVSLYRYAMSFMTVAEATDLLSALRALGVQSKELEEGLKERLAAEKKRHDLLTFMGKVETEAPKTAEIQKTEAAKPAQQERPPAERMPERQITEQAAEEEEEPEEAEEVVKPQEVDVKYMQLSGWLSRHREDVENAVKKKHKIYQQLLGSMPPYMAQVVLTLFNSDEAKAISNWFDSLAKIKGNQFALDSLAVHVSRYLDGPVPVSLTPESYNMLMELSELFQLPPPFLADELVRAVYEVVMKMEVNNLEELKKRLLER
ncbi:MAG: ParB N-terminal domain-containing protein [Thermoproteus sp.]